MMFFNRQRRGIGSHKSYEESDEEDEPLNNIKMIIKEHASIYKTPSIYVNKTVKIRLQILMRFCRL